MKIIEKECHSLSKGNELEVAARNILLKDSRDKKDDDSENS